MVVHDLPDVVKLLRTGALNEHQFQNIELKAKWKTDFGKELSAMGNRCRSHPGFVLVGVTDDGKAVGSSQGWAKKTEEAISDQCAQLLDPAQAVDAVVTLEHEGKWFVLVQVRNPGAVVYWKRVAYKSVGSSSTAMGPAEVMALQVALPGLEDYTAQPSPDESNPDLLKAFIEDLQHRSSEPELANLRVLSNREVLHRLSISDTRTARILFGPTKWRLVCIDEAGEVTANRTRRGLYRLLQPGFITEVQEWTAQALGQEAHPYPERAVHEALANAVAHAAYFEEDGGIMIELHAQHMIVSNLCTAETLYFANRWFSRAHKTVNKTLMEVLRLASHVDELGRGKGLILADSLSHGKRPPIVAIDRAGRFFRWSTILMGGSVDDRQLRLLERLRSHYRDERKALMANALIYWRKHKIKQLRNYVDGESALVMAELLTDDTGPIWYDQEGDIVELRRWVEVLLEDGADSRELDKREELFLLELSRKFCCEYFSSEITSKRFRELAGLGNTPSEQQQTYKVLKRWEAEGHIARVGHGKYEFVAAPDEESDDRRTAVLDLLQGDGQDPPGE